MTSRAQILAAARQLIDRDGWEKLTVRRLAAEMRIGPTTLYHHVQDKEDLLVLLLNEYADQIPQPELPGEPRERIVVAATAIHDALAVWPWVAEVLTTDGFIARIGDSGQRLVEAILAGAIEHGCTHEQAVDVFRNVWYYTVGEILIRAHSARSAPNDNRSADHGAFFGNLDATQLPHLAAIGEQWPVLAARDTYPQALRALVDGLLGQATPEAG